MDKSNFQTNRVAQIVTAVHRHL